MHDAHERTFSQPLQQVPKYVLAQRRGFGQQHDSDHSSLPISSTLPLILKTQ